MINLKNRIFLAPMEGVNDIAFRVLCKKAGASLTWTGMINPLSKEKLYLDDKPILQLFCNSEKGIKEFMKKYDKKVSGWDFNLGCPVKRAMGAGVGSFLIDLEKIGKILKIMRENTKKLLFVKIRKSSRAFDILKIAEKLKLNGVIVHGRTQKQGYSGLSDVNWCEKFKSKSKIPVIYSGDVSVNNIKSLSERFDGVMVGRRAIGNPGVFGKKFDFNSYLKLADKYKLKFNQVKQQALWFTKGKEGSRKLREMIAKCRNIKEMKKIIQ